MQTHSSQASHVIAIAQSEAPPVAEDVVVLVVVFEVLVEPEVGPALDEPLVLDPPEPLFESSLAEQAIDSAKQSGTVVHAVLFTRTSMD
ncbi:MAG TPA: hypothetical protein VFB62_28115 [Polyangiaceae bacterium]|nr:hypothetical protein [Polyangiaceae bacterium]